MQPIDILWTIVAVLLVVDIVLDLKDRFNGWKNNHKKGKLA
ncbi:MAG: hypothetical protein ACKD6M_01255 [Candidatus Bathyarchaeota archaeon]